MSIDSEKASDKVQPTFMKNIPQHNKGHIGNPQVTTYSMQKRVFPPKSGTGQGCPL